MAAVAASEQPDPGVNVVIAAADLHALPARLYTHIVMLNALTGILRSAYLAESDLPALAP